MPMVKVGTSTYNGTSTPVYLMQGNAVRDAEDKPVNGKDHAVVGIAALEDKDGKTVFVTLNGWRQNYAAVRNIRKGDSILAVGRFKKREYNGKDYFDLDADFVCKSGAGLIGGDGVGDLPDFDSGGGNDDPSGFAEIEEDGELPF